MRVQTIVRCLPVALLVVASMGCENQQPVVNKLKTEMAELKKEVADAGDKAKQLLADKDKVQDELDAMKTAAENAKNVAAEALASATTTLKKEADDAIQAAKTAAGEALAAATKRADDAMEAVKAAKGQITAAESNAAELQKLLDQANANIAVLEAAAKEAEKPEGE